MATTINLTLFDDFFIPRLLVTSNIGVSVDNSNIFFNSTGSVSNGTNIGSGTGVFNQINSGILEFKSLVAGSNVDISTDGTVITVASTNVVISATNLDTSAAELFVQNNAGVLEFKSILAGSYIAITEGVSNIIISANSDVDITATNIGTTGVGVFNFDTGHILEFKNLVAGNGVDVSTDGTYITISSTSVVVGATNVDTSAGELFIQNNGGILEFKSILAGSYITLTEGVSNIVINASPEIDVSATNIGTTGVGVFNLDAGGILEFKNIVAGSYVNVSTDGTNLTITSTNIFVSATNLGLVSGGLFVQNNAGVVELKSVSNGSGISISSTGNNVVITNDRDNGLFGLCSGVGNATSLLRFLRYDGSPATNNPHTPALMNKAGSISGFAVALHNHISTITIPTGLNMEFSIGRIPSGTSIIAANFTTFAGAPHITWDANDNDSWVNKQVVGLDLSYSSGERVYVSAQGGASVSNQIFDVDWSLWYK
jgi:hypothetical protein